MKMRTKSIISLTLLLLLIFKANAAEIIKAKKYDITIGYYNISPESKNARKIAFTEILSNDKANIVVLDLERNKVEYRKPIELYENHNGAKVIWIDENHVAYMNGWRTLEILNLKKNKTIKYVNFILGQSSNTEEVLAYRNGIKGGIYFLNKSKELVKEVLTWQKIEKEYLRKSPLTNKWKLQKIYHPEIDYERNLIATRIDVGTNKKTIEKLIVSFDLNEDKTFVFTPLPLHYTLKNGNLLGFNRVKPKNTLVKWDINGTALQAYPITGNHLAVSKSGRYFAYENYYDSSPVKLKLYDTLTKKEYEVYETTNIEKVWKERFHVNPAFNTNETKLYYNCASKYLNEICISEIKEITKK